MRKTISFLLAVTLIISISVPAWAANYTVGSDDEFSTKWTEASANSDSKNTFNLTADINAGDQNAKSGKTYVITTGNDSTISDLGVTGKGKVEINKCNVEVGLTVQGANVTIADSCDVDVDVTSVNQAGTLTVNPDADLGIVRVYSGTLDAKNDVDADGVMIIDGEMSVDGDLTTTGNVNTEPIIGYRPDRVVLMDDSELTVGGNIDTSFIIIEDSSKAEVNGDLITDAPDFMRNGPYMGSYHPSVAVNDNSELIVNGKIEGMVSVVNDSVLEAAKGITADYGDCALVVGEARDLDVGLGGGTSDPNDKSEVYSGTIVSTTGTALITKGKTTTSVHGNAEGSPTDVKASGESSVTIVSMADKVVTKDKAVVTVYGLKPNSSTNNLNPTTYHVKASGTLDDDLVDKCIEYTYGSALQKQYSDMIDGFLALSNQLMKNISGIKGALNAVGIAAVDRDKIYSDMITNGELSFEVSAAINNDFAKLCNEDSNEALKNRKKLNPYLISVSCDTLASVLDDAENDPDLMDAMEKGLKEDKKVLKKINSIIKTATKATENLGKKKDERMLDEIFKAIDEAMEAAGKTSELGIKYAEFSDFLGEFAKKAKTAGKVVKWGTVAVDLANYWFEDCSNELIMLETVLKTQPLSAEGYVAGLSIREAYINKVYGTVDKICDVAGEEVTGSVVDTVLSAVPPAELIDLAFQMGATLFGGADRVDASTTACALTEICPSAINAYEAAILNVKNGDTSDEAVLQVQLSYAYAKATLEEFFDSMITLSRKESVKNDYQKKLDRLENMSIGEPIGKIL